MINKIIKIIKEFDELFALIIKVTIKIAIIELIISKPLRAVLHSLLNIILYCIIKARTIFNHRTYNFRKNVDFQKLGDEMTCL